MDTFVNTVVSSLFRSFSFFAFLQIICISCLHIFLIFRLFFIFYSFNIFNSFISFIFNMDNVLFGVAGLTITIPSNINHLCTFNWPCNWTRIILGGTAILLIIFYIQLNWKTLGPKELVITQLPDFLFLKLNGITLQLIFFKFFIFNYTQVCFSSILPSSSTWNTHLKFYM